MTIRLTVHRGTKEIGGSCIEIATQTTRIIFDVGLPLFDRDRQPVDSNRLRSATLEKLLLDGWISPVPGLFSNGPSIDAIFLSHAHEDHAGLISHTRPDIPISASRGTSKMMLAGSIFARQTRLPRERFRQLLPEKSVCIGDLEIMGIPVDHSVFGAMAFLIRTQGKTILYSGDLRAHGRKPGMHARLIELARRQPIDVLLMEGTHIGHPDYGGLTEYGLERDVRARVNEHPGLVLASFSPQHVDRLTLFLRVARQTGRQFVADVYTAFILHLLRTEGRFPAPESTEWIRIFVPKALKANLRRIWVKKISPLFSRRAIESSEIFESPDRILMLFRPSMLDLDFGGWFPHRTLCLYSRWLGYLDQPEWLPVKAALQRAEGNLVEAHTSGHIFFRDLADMISRIDPKLVVPVHTFEPERFLELTSKVRLLADSETLQINT